MRLLSLILSLFIFWLLLSGLYKPWLVGWGLAVAIFIGIFIWRAKLLDDETHPIEYIFRAVFYWPWLVKEIIVSALSVSRQILSPQLTIRPRLLRIKASQSSALGLVTYANSITLTPGTISARVNNHDKEILVHALNDDGVEGLLSGEMDARVAKIYERGST